MKTIYLIKHSGPFVDIKNYEDYENILWEDYNKNMILSVEGEKRAEKLCEIEELNNMIAFKDMLLQTTYEEAMRLEDEVENLTKQLEEAKKNSNNIVDEANKQIKQANQDQVDILDAVNQAKEKINNN